MGLIEKIFGNKKEEYTGPYLIVAFVFNVGPTPNGELCNRIIRNDPAWKLGKAGKVQVHPIGGWDGIPPNSSLIYSLIKDMHPDIMIGVDKRQIFYDFIQINKEQGLVSVYGDKFWKDFVSLKSLN